MLKVYAGGGWSPDQHPAGSQKFHAATGRSDKSGAFKVMRII